MFTGTDFSYNGILASSFGLLVVNVGSKDSDRPFGLQREIRETSRIDGKNSYHGLSNEPLEFTITLAREEEWDLATRKDVVKWLFQNNYKELIDTDHPTVIYNALIYSDSEIFTVGNIPRYITLNIRTDAAWGWTQSYEYEHDCDTTLDIQITNLTNLNMPVYTEVEVTLESGNSFEIQFDTDKVFKFMNATYGGDTYTLVIGETIYVNNDKKIILSDQTGSEDKRIKNFIKSDATKERSDWFYLTDGVNDITLIGNATFIIRVKYPVMI